ncbi:MAG: polysaccharide export protein [Thermoanaerobaculia bacterium]|nr:polysaccharide export protein [Thermoanaerobaculia bacterium]
MSRIPILHSRRNTAAFLAGAVAAVAVVLLLLATPGWSQGAGYRVGPKDLIEIEVFEAPEFNTQTRVSEEGSISLPVIGDVQVNGLSDEALTARLRQILEECCIQKASVSVQVVEFNSRPISVIGAVSRPGPLNFSGRWTLLEALTAAGGLAPSHGDVVHILRRAENGLTDQIQISLQDLLVVGDPRVNVPIFANDLINVPVTMEVTIFCLGEVERPGALVFKSTERITLLTAIARAGGMTDRSSRKITIKREARGGALAREIVVDYKDILSGKSDDMGLLEGDVVVVKESFF